MLQAETARVVDDNMNDVPADGATMGEIVLRGNNVMLGYYKDPDATAEAFAGGWFHTGDLGVMHPDGYIQLKDRAKDIIISGGENISTVEVEQAIMAHAAVIDVAVVGVPDEKWGERPKAFVILKDGQTATATTSSPTPAACWRATRCPATSFSRSNCPVRRPERSSNSNSALRKPPGPDVTPTATLDTR